MKFVKYIFLILLIFSCDDSNSDDSQTSELEGSWTGINAYYATQQDIDNTYTFTFTENNCEINGILYYENNEEIPVIGFTTFTTNTEVEPNQIDITIISYEIGGDALEEYYSLTSLGIYEIQGDSLKFTSGEPGELERPSEFTSDGQNAQLFLLVRD